MAEPALQPPSTPVRILRDVPAHPCPPPGPALDAVLAQTEETLPDTDGQPLPDSVVQHRLLANLEAALREYFRGQEDHVSVGSDHFVYFTGEADDRAPVTAAVAPDLFVAFGGPDRPKRKSFVLHNEPETDIRFVLEVASESTRSHDHGPKRRIYASMGVAEYFLFDPPSAHRPANLIGLTLDGRTYRELPKRILPNGWVGVQSRVLELGAYVRDDLLWWFNPATGRDLIDTDGAMTDARNAPAKIQAAKAEAAKQAARADAAEARIAALEAALRAARRRANDPPPRG